MPRYFFAIQGTRWDLDEVGEELPDEEAAWKQATITAGEIFKEVDGKFRPGEEWRLEVSDEKRQPLYLIVIHAKAAR